MTKSRKELLKELSKVNIKVLRKLNTKKNIRNAKRNLRRQELAAQKNRNAKAIEKRSRAAKRGWATKRLRELLETLEKEARRGKGVAPGLGKEKTHAEYLKTKKKAKREFGKKTMKEILERLQERLNLDDIGWNVVY